MNTKLLLGIFGVTMLLIGCSEKPQERTTIVGDVSKGKAIFAASCTACHQKDGKGKPGFAPSINNIDFLAVADDQMVKRFILEGRPGTTMMSFKNNPKVAENIDDLVAYIRSWSKDYTLYKEVPLDYEWESNGDMSKGEALFENYCSACHGSDGIGYSAGGSGTGIGNPSFVSLVPDDYIKQTLLLGRAGTAMKPFDGAKGVANLSDSEMNDIVSFLRSKGAYEKIMASDLPSSEKIEAAEEESIIKSLFSDPYIVVIIAILLFTLFVLLYIVSILLRLKKIMFEDKD